MYQMSTVLEFYAEMKLRQEVSDKRFETYCHNLGVVLAYPIRNSVITNTVLLIERSPQNYVNQSLRTSKPTLVV